MMVPKKTESAGARATVELEIFGLGSWGPECTVSQIYNQAAEGARGRLEKLIQVGQVNKVTGFRIIGEPKVTAVLCRENE